MTRNRRSGRQGGRHEARSPRSETSPFAPDTYLVEGLAAVAEYVRFRPKALLDIRCIPKERAKVEELLRRHDVTVPIRDRGEEEERPSAPVSARVSLKALEPEAFFARLDGRSKDLILALDHVQDPRNLGAIARSAAFFGVREVVVPERRQVLLTQASVATAQGGFALCDLVCVVNLSRALRELKERGYWVVGAAMDGEALPALVGVYNKVVLVLGAEETGISRSVRELCDRLVAIQPGRAAAHGTLDSLNVSVAAGIFLHALAVPEGS